jgi:phosphoglycerate dehydrogenase-like enzyme
LFAAADEEARAILARADLTPVFRRSNPVWSPDQVVEALSDAVAVIASTERYDESVFSRAPGRKIISRTGVGDDAVDLEAATHHGVVVSTTPGANDRTVADFAMTLMLALARNLFAADREVRAGRWERPAAVEMRDKVVGIVGVGAIGKHVARRAHGFECQLLGYDVVQDEAFAERYGLRYVPLDLLVAEADFLTIHAPYLPSTHRLIGEAQLRAMKPSAVLVNTARGPLVDERALVRALAEGWIAGAGLDVFETEPLPSDSPLRDLPNVILAPHCAGISYESGRAMARIAAENVVAVLSGRPPVLCVNPAVLETLGLAPRS